MASTAADDEVHAREPTGRKTTPTAMGQPPSEPPCFHSITSYQAPLAAVGRCANRGRSRQLLQSLNGAKHGYTASQSASQSRPGKSRMEALQH